MAVIDAMLVVQKIVAQDKKAKNDKRIKTCSDFYAAFVNKIESMTRTFHKVRIVFDYYEEFSLKNATRSKTGNSNDGKRFIIHEDTSIDPVSNIPTKQDFTVYLANKVRSFLDENGVILFW